MKFKPGPYYLFFTAFLFASFAIWFRFAGYRMIPNLEPVYREGIFWVLLAWACFRGLNGYYALKRKQRDEKKLD